MGGLNDMEQKESFDRVRDPLCDFEILPHPQGQIKCEVHTSVV